MSRSRLHAPRCCFDTHPQLQRRTTLAALVDALLCRRPTSMPQLYHRSKCCVNVFCKMVSANVRKMLPVQHPLCRRCRCVRLCSYWQQVLTACEWVVATLCGLHHVRTGCWKEHRLTNVIFLFRGWCCIQLRWHPQWTTPAPIIYRVIPAIIIYVWVILSARIIVSRYARKANEIKGLA